MKYSRMPKKVIQMTMVSEIDFENDEKYVKLFDHGFVGLVDYMGDDEAIVEAARTSYGKGTKKSSSIRGLIRRLMRDRHTSPFEMGELKFHFKIPIFVMRQISRHRTCSLNEWSGRYSEMTDEFYIPNLEDIKPQSKTNRQGREGNLPELRKIEIRGIMRSVSETCYDAYMGLLADGHEDEGLARELARIVLPLNNYTELYWKVDLHNFLHFTKLRYAGDAQKEIQLLAQTMYEFVQKLFPLTCEAFEDYVRQATTLSRQEIILMKRLIDKNVWQDLVIDYRSEDNMAEIYDMSKRELREFKNKWIV